MREILQQILDGNFTSENNSLDFSCSKIEFSVDADCDYEGTFHIYASKGMVTEGFVTATDQRMECINCRIDGSDTEIGFHFHTDQCEPGDVIKESFCIVSNQGEYYLPFVVNVENAVLDSSMGPIRNLFLYTNLARSNWQEAVDLFYSPGFSKVFTGSDAHFKEYYRALCNDPGNGQNVEEFLISVGKKQRLEYITHTPEIAINLTNADTGLYEAEVEIMRNGWGYTHLDVICEGNFFFAEQSLLDENAFQGNVCRLKLFIDTDSCRHGKHYGILRLQNVFQTLEIPIIVSAGMVHLAKQSNHTKRMMLHQLTSDYVEYSLGRMNRDAWKRSSGKMIEQMVSMDEDDCMSRLYQAAMLIEEDRENEAVWVLDHVSHLLEQKTRGNMRSEQGALFDLPCCYHWYLTSLVRDDEAYTREAASQVERRIRRGSADWRLVWLYLQFDLPSLELTTRWTMLEQLFEDGCNSPLLYMEAVEAFNQNPPIARKLDRFTLQVIFFGAKYHAISPDALEQVIYLSSKAKDPIPLLLRAMEFLYESMPGNRLLAEICSQLIKNNCTDERAFSWYLRGVQEDLKLTGLYESFVSAIDLRSNVEIPRIVLMYFSYQNHLDYAHQAYLYHYLIHNKRELSELYASNRNAMERFAYEQMKKGRISRHLAAVYEDILPQATLDEACAYGLAELLFANWISVDQPGFDKVLVFQKNMAAPAEYLLSDGQGWAAIYGSDYTLAFEDKRGNRLLKSVTYTLEKLMLPGRHIRIVSGLVWEHVRLNQYLCDNEPGNREVNADTIRRYRQLVQCPEIIPQFRRKMLFETLEYYFQSGDNKTLNQLLEQLDPNQLDREDKRKGLRYLILTGHRDMVMEWLEQMGSYFAEPKDLQRFLDQILQDEQNVVEPSETLDAAAIFAFRKGRMDSLIVEYLCKRFHGLCRDLRNLWRAAGSYGIDRTDLEEKLLLQMLYSGAYVGEQMDIFRSYLEKGRDEELIHAFLAQSAYDYFVKEKLIDGDIFRRLHQQFEQGEDLSQVSKLAYLKYFSENPDEIDADIRRVILEFLQDMFAQRIHLSFFTQFQKGGVFPEGRERKELERLLEDMVDRTIIDYRARNGAITKIHYAVVREDGVAQDYVSENMRDVCGGVCFKEFVLFFGESLQYYITEEFNGESQLTQSGSLQKNDLQGGDNSRYSLINDMLISNTLQDYDTLDKLMEEYAHRSYLNQELFQLL